MAGIRSIAAALVVAVSPAPAARVQAQIPEHEAQRIREAAPDRPRIPPKQPRRVLIWNTPLMEASPHKGYCIPYGTVAWQVLGEQTGAYEPVVSDDLTMLLPANLQQFDAIVLNNADGQWIRPTEEAMERLRDYGPDQDAVEQLLRQSLLDFVAGGQGLVATHFAIGGNPEWPEFHELLGATYWGHPWNEEVGVKVEEPDHPLVAAFSGQSFRVAEEVFQFNEPYSREKLRVLLTLDTEHTNMGVPWVYRTDGDFALAWVQPWGQGRVFYTALGHRTELYWNPQILQFYLDGVQFAMGDLEAPFAPLGTGG